MCSCPRPRPALESFVLGPYLDDPDSELADRTSHIQLTQKPKTPNPKPRTQNQGQCQSYNLARHQPTMSISPDVYPYPHNDTDLSYLAHSTSSTPTDSESPNEKHPHPHLHHSHPHQHHTPQEVQVQLNEYPTLTSLTTPFWSSDGKLDTVPSTPWPYPYNSSTPMTTMSEGYRYAPGIGAGTPYSAQSTWGMGTGPMPMTGDGTNSGNGSGMATWLGLAQSNGMNTPMDGSVPPPPPNTASHGLSNMSNAYTGLSPLFAGFSTTPGSPTSASSQVRSAGNTSGTTTPGHGGSGGGGAGGNTGPMRYPLGSTPSRRRSSTLVTVDSATSTSMSPATPHSGYYGYPYSYPYPYPSPRSSLPNTNSTNTGPGFDTGVGATPPGLVRRPSAPAFTNSQGHSQGHGLGLTPTCKRFHPNPHISSPGLAVDLSLDMDNHMNALGHESFGGGGGDGYIVSNHVAQSKSGSQTPSIGDVKPPRFKPTKDQLEILVASYEENK